MKGTGVFTTFVILVGVLMMFIGQNSYEYDLENDKVKSMKNLSIQLEEILVYNSTNHDMVTKNISDTLDFNLSELRFRRVNKALDSFINFVIVSTFEGSKFLIEFGYSHPEYDFEFYFNFVRLTLYALIIMALVPIIIPLIALIYILGVGIKIIILYLIKMFKQEEVQDDS